MPCSCKELATAHERIRQLELQLIGDWEPPIEWGLTMSERRLLRMLMHRQYVSRDAYSLMAEAGGGAEVCAVFVAHLRRVLRPFGVAINNRWGVGYYITRDDKARLRDAA